MTTRGKRDDDGREDVMFAHDGRSSVAFRYDQNTVLRFLIDRCGQRAGYVEDCEVTAGPPASPDAVRVSDVAWCRYLLLSRVPLRPVSPAADGFSSFPKPVER